MPNLILGLFTKWPRYKVDFMELRWHTQRVRDCNLTVYTNQMQIAAQ